MEYKKKCEELYELSEKYVKEKYNFEILLNEDLFGENIMSLDFYESFKHLLPINVNLILLESYNWDILKDLIDKLINECKKTTKNDIICMHANFEQQIQFIICPQCFKLICDDCILKENDNISCISCDFIFIKNFSENMNYKAKSWYLYEMSYNFIHSLKKVYGVDRFACYLLSLMTQDEKNTKTHLERYSVSFKFKYGSIIVSLPIQENDTWILFSKKLKKNIFKLRNISDKEENCKICFEKNRRRFIICPQCENIICQDCAYKIITETETMHCPFCRYYI